MEVLGNVCQFLNGGTPSKAVSSYFEGDIPWITSADIIGPVAGTARSFITEEAIQKSATNKVSAGTVLLVTRTGVGKVAIAGMDLCFSQDITAIVPDGAKLDVGYLVQYLRTKQAHFERVSRGATIKGITRDVVSDLPIPLPSLPEQRRIAAILDQADALRAKRREALAQLDSLTQSIFIEMFGNPIENPRNFPIRKLIEIVDSERPISYGILMPGPDVEEGVKYVRVVDMKSGGIELSGVRKTTADISNSYKRSLLKTGDLLLSIRGHVGRLAIVPKELNGANITQDTARLAITCVSTVYVRECLRTLGFQRWMAKHTKGIAVQGINLGDVKLMPIPLPSRKYQDAFSERASSIEKLITVQRKSLADLDALFSSLQHRVFRGEL